MVIAPHPVAGHQRKEPGTIPLALALEISIWIGEIPPSVFPSPDCPQPQRAGKEPVWKTGERRGRDRGSLETGREKRLGESCTIRREKAQKERTLLRVREGRVRAAPGRWDGGMGLGMGFRMEVEIPLTSAKGPPAARGLQPRSPRPAPPPATGDGGGQRPAEAKHPLQLRNRPWYIPGTGPGTSPVPRRHLARYSPGTCARSSRLRRCTRCSGPRARRSDIVTGQRDSPGAAG